MIELLRRIELFLKRRSMSEVRLGRRAAGDPRFVADLRRGRRPRSRTVARVTAWLDQQEAGLAARLNPAGEQLKRALLGSFAFEGEVHVEEIASRAWASVTFSGARHWLRLRLEGAGAGAAVDGWLDGLEEREFALRDHLLADIVLVADERSPEQDRVLIELEALTVEEA